MRRYRVVPKWFVSVEQQSAGVCGHIGYRTPQLWRVFASDRSGRYRVACYRLGCTPTDSIGGPWTKQFEVLNGIRTRVIGGGGVE